MDNLELTELKAHIDNRLDRLENKMDTHLDRISKTEIEIAKQQAEISWVKGSVKFGVTILVSVIGGIVSWFLKFR